MVIVNNPRILQLVYAIFIFLIVHFPMVADAKPSSTITKPANDVRLYALNCGYLDIHDMTRFSNTDFYPHHKLRLANLCVLIKHPKGWLLWDLGLGDQYLNHKVEDKKHHVTIIVPISLITQLKQLRLNPSDIKYIALSHVHFDHIGNIKLFPNATLLMQKSEYEFIQQKPLSSAVNNNTFQILKSMHKVLLDGDYDVFGDGVVQILNTPGHTPGHESLKVVLPHQGTIILAGDLFHTRQAYLNRLVPIFNTNPAETLSSMNRIDSILHNTHGRLIVQHDLGDFSSLPKIPGYLS